MEKGLGMFSWQLLLVGFLAFLPDRYNGQGFQPGVFPQLGQRLSHDWSNQGGWAHVANNGGAGGDVQMPDGRLFPQRLHVGGRRNYFIDVQQGGSVAVTVHPRQGRITWNITYQNVNVMRHPQFTHRLQAPYRPSRSRGRRHAQELVDDWSTKRSGRQRRSAAVRGAVRHNFDFDVPELDAGLGQSLGPGAITYSKEDTGGRYIMDVANRGSEPAEFFIYATLSPINSPYPRAVGDPQAKIEDVLPTEVTVSWLPIPEAPLGTQYCVFYHNAKSHTPSDVHSSAYASHLSRPTAVKAGCTRQSHMLVRGLQPNQEYHLDVFSQSPTSKLFTTYLGVRTTTDHRSYVRSPTAPRLPTSVNRIPNVVDVGSPRGGAGPRAQETIIGEGTRSVIDLDVGRPLPGAATNSASTTHSLLCRVVLLSAVLVLVLAAMF